MTKRIFSFLAGIGAWAAVTGVFAQTTPPPGGSTGGTGGGSTGGGGGGGRTLSVDGLGADVTLMDLMSNLISIFTGMIVLVCIVIFLAGAFLMVFSHGEQDQLQQGKDFMIKSMIGLAVVMSSYAILRTVFFLLY